MQVIPWIAPFSVICPGIVLHFWADSGLVRPFDARGVTTEQWSVESAPSNSILSSNSAVRPHHRVFSPSRVVGFVRTAGCLLQPCPCQCNLSEKERHSPKSSSPDKRRRYHAVRPLMAMQVCVQPTPRWTPSRREPFCTVLLAHLSESISGFKRTLYRPHQTAYYPLVAGSSQDTECTRVTLPVMSISQNPQSTPFGLGSG